MDRLEKSYQECEQKNVCDAYQDVYHAAPPNYGPPESSDYGTRRATALILDLGHYRILAHLITTHRSSTSAIVFKESCEEYSPKASGKSTSILIAASSK
jgi:hypothetical protein